MDARLAIGILAAIYAFMLVTNMEPGLMRLLRMKWNAYWRDWSLR